MSKFLSGTDMTKTCKFKPRKIPRYLPGSVDKQCLRLDLKEYNQHLSRIYYAKPIVDDKAPPFHSRAYFKTMEMNNDFFSLKNIDRDNKELLKIINRTNRTGGKVDTFNMYAYQNLSKWNFKKIELNQIKKENQILDKRIKEACSDYSKERLEKEWKITAQQILTRSKYPCDLFKKKDFDGDLRKFPSISNGLKLLCDDKQRLKYFMEFQIENGLKLGKIIMELYYDFVPNAIQSFLKCCMSDSFRNNRIQKVYKNKHCILGNFRKTYTKEEESSCIPDSVEEFLLKHSRAGVISMVPTEKKNWDGILFSITFDEMPELDGKFLVIGKTIRGAVNLFKINDFGSKFGRPTGNIIVSDCGIYQK